MQKKQPIPQTSSGKWNKALPLLLAFFLLFYGCYAVTNHPAPERLNNNLVIHYIDVGQADASLILFPDGKSMLIDAGDNATADEVVQYIKDQGVTRLDCVVATHPHADHIGGMDKVIDTFDIGEFYMPKLPDKLLPTTRTFEDMLVAMDQKDITPKSAKTGAVLFSGTGLNVEILSPLKADYEDLNHNSAVVMVAFGKQKFLFMGDAEKENENVMLKNGDDVQADVIKIGHHGSKNASTEKFIKAVQPDYAILSCGKDNSYGHPHERVLKLLQKQNVKVFRTDENGTIVLQSDGSTLIFTPYGQ